MPMEEATEVEEEAEGLVVEEIQDEEAIAAAGYLEHVVEVIDMEQEQLHPYQLTHFYQNLFISLQENFEEWINEEYECEQIVFEHQQQQLYNEALILEGDEQQQQHQDLIR
jgi:hypothetical protein